MKHFSILGAYINIVFCVYLILLGLMILLLVLTVGQVLCKEIKI